MPRIQLKPTFTVLLALLLVPACDPAEHVPGRQEVKLSEAQVVARVRPFLLLARVQNRQMATSGEQLRHAIAKFLEDPVPERLAFARNAWNQAHEDFCRSRGFMLDERHYRELLFNIDAWPIQEGFLDALPGYPYSGIVNDITLVINPQTLREQHGISDSTEASLGFHALEYFLWERSPGDLSLPDAGLPGTGPERESSTGDQPVAVETVLRRREVVRIISVLLSEDLRQLSILLDSHYTEFETLPATEILDTLLHLLRSSTHQAFTEVNLILDQDMGHSRFSQSSWRNVESLLSTLQAIVEDPVAMKELFRQLSEKENLEFTAALKQVIILVRRHINEPKASQQDQADPKLQITDVPLLLSAMVHLLEDFRRLSDPVPFG